MSFLDNFTTTSNSDNRYRVIDMPTENTLTIGSSVTHTFSLPFSYTEYVNYCEILYKQGMAVILNKKDFTVQEANDNASCILKVFLTSEDTVKFKPNCLDVFVQLKIVSLTGEISYSEPTKIKILSSSDEGVTSKHGYLYKNKINDYLYEIEYDTLDYDYAMKYIKSRNDGAATGCTSIRWGNYFARNLDWFYGNSVTFIVRTPSANGRYATLGISGSLDQFTTENIDEDKEEYKALPFYINDGINEKGLVMSTNVVPSLGNKATITTGSKYNEVYSTALVRYCLDNFASVEELKRELPKHTSLINIAQISALGYESHWLIADSTSTTILEIKDNKMKFLDTIGDKKAVMANFHLDGVLLNGDNTVYTPATVASGFKPSQLNNIELKGEGLERHNYTINVLNQINGDPTEDDMRAILNGLAYTKSYTTSYAPADPFWYTDLVSNGDLTIDTLPEDFAEQAAIEGEAFINRVRGDKKTWYTNHASIYDITEKKLYLVVEEDSDKEYILGL